MTEIFAACLIQDSDRGVRVVPTEKQAEPQKSFWQGLSDRSPFWRKVVGWICFAVGVFGIILPILPGIPFLVAGLLLLSTEYRWVRSLLIWIKRKMGRWWPRKIQIPRERHRNSRREDRPL